MTEDRVRITPEMNTMILDFLANAAREIADEMVSISDKNEYLGTRSGLWTAIWERKVRELVEKLPYPDTEDRTILAHAIYDHVFRTYGEGMLYLSYSYLEKMGVEQVNPDDIAPEREG